jgi:hypothetical protein
MCHDAFFLADSDAEKLVYIIAVAVLFVVGWVIERFKAMMADSSSNRDPAHRPPRSASPPLRRPQIPPMGDRNLPGQPRPVPPPVSRPAPPVRPPAPQPAPPARTGVPAPVRPLGRPVTERTLEERKAIIRGEPARPVPKAPRTSVPSRPAPAAPVIVEESEDASRVRLASDWAERTQSVSVAQPPHAAKVSAMAKPQSVLLGSLNRDELRRALVLKEILEPPLALRE